LSRFGIQCFMLVLLLISWATVAQEEAKPQQEKFTVGMAMDDVLKILVRPYEVLHGGQAYVFPGEPTERQKQEDGIYLVRATGEGLNLVFNHYKKLISVSKIKLTPSDVKKELRDRP